MIAWLSSLECLHPPFLMWQPDRQKFELGMDKRKVYTYPLLIRHEFTLSKRRAYRGNCEGICGYWRSSLPNAID